MSRTLRGFASIRLCLAGTSLACLPACGSREPVETPFLPPPVEIAEEYHFGTPLSGPRAGDPDGITAETSFHVRFTLYGLETYPAGAFEPLSAHRGRLVVMGAGKPVQATERLSREIRVSGVDESRSLLESIEGGSFARASPVAMVEGAVVPGATCRLRIELRPRTEGAPAAEQLDVEAWAPIAAEGEETPRALLVTIAREGWFVPEAGDTQGGDFGAGTDEVEDGAASSESPVPGELRREISVLKEGLNAPGEGLAGVVPVAEGPVDAYGFVLELLGGPGASVAGEPRHLGAFERLREGLAQSATGEVSLTEVIEELGVGNVRMILRRTADALADATARRRAILYVAGESQANLAADLALSGSDEILARMADRILARIQAIEGVPEEGALGWAFEAGTLEAIAHLLEEEGGRPEMEGLLALHLGQVGRQAAAIERVVGASRSLGDLEARLLEENTLFLEDGSPQARARAVRWLEARERAPAGYDPLAPARERRAALEEAAALDATASLKEDTQ